MVFLNYVFILHKPLNERSAVQVLSGITANIFMIWRSSGSTTLAQITRIIPT